MHSRKARSPHGDVLLEAGREGAAGDLANLGAVSGQHLQSRGPVQALRPLHKTASGTSTFWSKCWDDVAAPVGRGSAAHYVAHVQQAVPECHC